MNNDFFAMLLLGHLVGDYVLQTKNMAMNKNGNWFMCGIHCLIYTAAVSLFTMSYIHVWWWPVIVFATHFPVDYWSLADRWLDYIEGRSLKDFMLNGKKNIPANYDKENYHSLRGGFTALVYAVVDNTMHLTSMYLIGRMLL